MTLTVASQLMHAMINLKSTSTTTATMENSDFSLEEEFYSLCSHVTSTSAAVPKERKEIFVKDLCMLLIQKMMAIIIDADDTDLLSIKLFC